MYILYLDMKYNTIIKNTLHTLFFISFLVFFPQEKNVLAEVRFYSTEDAVEQNEEYGESDDREEMGDVKVNSVIYPDAMQ